MVDALDLKAVASTVRAGLLRICGDFTVAIADRGFRQTKKRVWVRRRERTADFILFESSPRPINHSTSMDIHFGIRVINDDFVALALNGPHSDAPTTRAGRYHLRFNAKSWDQYDRCLTDLLRLTTEVGEPWFSAFEASDALLGRPDSPLGLSMKGLLLADLGGARNPDNEKLSLKLLGLR